MANKKEDIKKNDHSYFYSLELEGINCFKDIQTLDLSDGDGNYSPWTIILGDNGTGKTTLLKILDRLQPSNYSDIEYLAILWTYRPFLKNNYLETKLILTNTDVKHFVNINTDNNRGKLGSIIAQKDNYFPFLLSYGASRRMSKNPKLSDKIEGSLNYTTLFDESIELINVEEWYLQKYLSYTTSKNGVKSQLKQQLDLIKNVIIDFLPEVKDLRIKEIENLNEKSSLQIKINNNVWIELRELSFGYQTITALLVDIASKMMEQYSERKNPLSEPVIILIDEIDLHLHPKWQRTVIDKLSHHFPKAQFIVTAHSPLIVQAAEDFNANIVVCRKEGDRVVIDNDPDNVKGWRVDQILTSDLFELESPRSKVTQENVDEYINLKGKDRLSESDKKKMKILAPLVEKAYNQNTFNSDLDKKINDFAEKFLK